MEKHDENGVNGYCPAFWRPNRSCMLRIGPRHCHGDANHCVLRHPEPYEENHKRNIRKELMQIIRENLGNPCLIDLNKISHSIMKKFIVRPKNNIGE